MSDSTPKPYRLAEIGGIEWFWRAVGILKRRLVYVDKSSIHYIGKESNELDEAEAIGVYSENYVEYHNLRNEKQKLVDAILASSSKAAQAGISRRHLFRLRKKLRHNLPIKLKTATVKKLMHCYT